MGHFEDANSLVKKSEQDLEGLVTAYQRSLFLQIVSPELLIDIKNLMENLRSALDYAAHGLFNSYGGSTKADTLAGSGYQNCASVSASTLDAPLVTALTSPPACGRMCSA